MALFGPDSEKIERWKQEGRVSRLRSVVDDGGPFAEEAQRALCAIVSDPSLLPGATDQAVEEAFGALLDLDQHAASAALSAYVASPAARAAVACRLIDRFASCETDAALSALLGLAGCRLADVGVHAVRALARMNHPRLPAAVRSALLLADHEALKNLLHLLEQRQIPGAPEALVHLFAKGPANLRGSVARALRRQGISAAQVQDSLLRAYLLAAEERFHEAAACGAEAWQPLAEALGPQPQPGDRTRRILLALAQVDRHKLYHALRLRLAKAASEASLQPTAATAAEVRAVAAWVLPALAELYERRVETRELAAQMAEERFTGMKTLLENM